MLTKILLIAFIASAYINFWLLLIIIKYKQDVYDLEDKIREKEGVEVWW